MVFVHINPQPGNLNRTPPSTHLRSKFIILQHGKQPIEFIFTPFSAALTSPHLTCTVKFQDISSADSNTSPGLRTPRFAVHGPTAASKKTNRDQLTGASVTRLRLLSTFLLRYPILRKLKLFTDEIINVKIITEQIDLLERKGGPADAGPFGYQISKTRARESPSSPGFWKSPSKLT